MTAERTLTHMSRMSRHVLVKRMTLVSCCASNGFWHELASWHALQTAHEMT